MDLFWFLLWFCTLAVFTFGWFFLAGIYTCLGSKRSVPIVVMVTSFLTLGYLWVSFFSRFTITAAG
jgi:hypothetical protein